MRGRAGRVAWTWTPPRIVAAGLWAVLALLVFANSYGVFNPDIKPEIYLAPARSLVAYLSAWQSTPELGFPSFNVGLAPVAAVVTVIRAIGFDANLAARILRLGLLTIAAVGAARLSRQVLQPPLAAWARLAAAVAYVANPYVVVAGGTLAILWPYALLPWLVSFLMRAVSEGRGWRWPAAAALVFAAMTGMNAGVVPLIQLVVVPAFVVLARQRCGCSWRTVGVAVLRWGLLAVLLSAYWLVPSALALAAGQTVLQNSESVQGIGVVSSWSEVLRGLGLWPLYGGDASGPWLPEQVAYLTNGVVVLLSFGWFVLVAAALAFARGAVRVAALAGLVLVATVMVGLYPAPGGRSPFAVLLGLGFDHVPGMAAFRTTNKAGAGLALVASVVVAAATQRVLERPRSRESLAVGVAALGVVLVGATAPVWTGGMYVSPMPVPEYWRQAAAALDAGPPDQRVWFLPGQVASDYRWSRERPDDLGNSLFTRPTLVRYVIPVTGVHAANLLQAADQGLQEGTLPPGTLSAVARRLGVGDVLVRNDVVWEKTRGARPQAIQTVVTADPGLQPAGNFGAPGQNTVSPTMPPANAWEAALPPVQHYRVAGASDPIRAESVQGSVILAGDGFGVPPAMAAGLIPDGTPYVYAADLDERAFAAALGSGARIILTDSNRRRTTVDGRLTDGTGPLLRPDQDPGSTRALFGPADQTTLSTGSFRVDATMTGSVFGTLPQAAPTNAVDGDPATAWWFGDFATATGQTLTMTSRRAEQYSALVVHTVSQGPEHITRVKVQAGNAVSEAPVEADGLAHLDLGGATSKSLKVTVTGIGGDSFNLVGISEVAGIPRPVTTTAVLPDTVGRLVAALPEGARASLARTPIDVELTRVIGVTTTSEDDEEQQLRRDFTLPDARTYAPTGSVAAGADVPDPLFDVLAGADSRIVARSSSRAFDLPTVRASQAVDGRSDTGWSPTKAQGAWVSFTGRRRTVHEVTLTQPPRAAGAGFATRVRVSVDGQVVGEGPAGAGTHRIRVPPTVGRTVRLTITRTRGPGLVRFLETNAAGGSVHFDARRAARACVPIARLDGHPVDVHPLRPITSSAPVPFAGCRHRLIDMSAGRHALRPAPGWTVDSLLLRDRTAASVRSGAAPTVSTTGGTTSVTVKVSPSATPYFLVLGQAYDPRWTASIDGHPAGPPVVVDGWSTGWRIPAGAAHVVTIRYAPQRAADWALVASLAGLVVCVGLLLRSPSKHPEPSPATSGRRYLIIPIRTSGPRSGRRRAAVAWAAILAGAWFLGGVVAVLTAAALLAWWLVRPPRPRTVMTVGVALLALTGPAFIVGNRTRWGTVTPDLVAHNAWPSMFALAGLVVLTVGVLLQSWPIRSARLPDHG